MFVHQCSACDKRQLIHTSQFTGLRDTEAGVVVDFTCWCGATQSTPVSNGNALPV